MKIILIIFGYLMTVFIPVWVGLLIWGHYQTYPFIPSIDVMFLPILIVLGVVGMIGSLVFVEMIRRINL